MSVTRSAEEEQICGFGPAAHRVESLVAGRECLVRLQTHLPASQVSLPVVLWEGGCIIKTLGMTSDLMKRMTNT